MNRILSLIFLIILLIIAVFVFLLWKGYQLSKEKELSILTYQKNYPIGENPKIEIKNNAAETICFSSCYPYYLEKGNGSLKSYPYGSCSFPDLAETCVESGESKFFELILDKMETKKGLHRIAVPACIGCTLQENFRRDKFFYSDEFTIK